MVRNQNLTEKGKRDLALIEKALNNDDKKAYNQLMQLYRDPIYYMLYEKVGNEEIAKDLTIEALGKAFMKLHMYTPTYTFSTWLFTIARNNCIDYLRKNKLPTISIDELATDKEGEYGTFDIPSADPNPENLMIKMQKIKMLRKIVSRLNPKYRELVRLRYFKELSYEEIAKLTETPIGTIKAQLYRSREQLFKMISGSKEVF